MNSNIFLINPYIIWWNNRYVSIEAKPSFSFRFFSNGNLHTGCWHGLMTGRRSTQWRSSRRPVSPHAGVGTRLSAHNWEPCPCRWPLVCTRSSGCRLPRLIQSSRCSGKTRCGLTLQTWWRWTGRRPVRRWIGWRSSPRIGPVSWSCRSLRCRMRPVGTRCPAWTCIL